jgi:hypothetical protein
MPDNASRFFPFGIVRRHAGAPEADIMYSLGMPGMSSIYADQFMRNLRAGRPGYAGFPDWFTSQLGGGGSGTGGNGGGSSSGGGGSANFGNIPQWWRDWYNAQGKHGGVPPVQGLL